MGLPISAILAEAVMQYIERIAISKFPIKLLTFARYVDDIIISWPDTKEKLLMIKKELERHFANIKFTIEKEGNIQLTYLYMHIKKR